MWHDDHIVLLVSGGSFYSCVSVSICIHMKLFGVLHRMCCPHDLNLSHSLEHFWRFPSVALWFKLESILTPEADVYRHPSRYHMPRWTAFVGVTGTITILSYNSNTFGTAARRKEVLSAFDAHFVGIQGTRFKRPGNEPCDYTVACIDGFTVVDLFSSKEDGCHPTINETTGIANCSRWDRNCIARIFSPPSHLRGRGGMVLWYRPGLRSVLQDNVYFPPEDGAEATKNVIHDLCDWQA